jgi:hypothetical protein
MITLPNWRPMEYGRVAVGAFALTTFGIVVLYVMIRGIPKDRMEAFNLVVTPLVTLVYAVGKWFFDSSPSSEGKNATIAQQAENMDLALRSTPPPPDMSARPPIEPEPSPAPDAPARPVAALAALALGLAALLAQGHPAAAVGPPARQTAPLAHFGMVRPVHLAADTGPRGRFDPPGGATLPTKPPQTAEAFDGLKKAIIADITWARADAARRKDTRHLPCWDAWLAWLNSEDFPTFVPPHLGFFSTVQIGFDLAAGPQAIIPEDLLNSCGATSFDARIGVIDFVVKAGLGALLPIK